MAEERIPEIVVPLRYEYNDAGLKKMSQDIQSFTSSKGINSITKGFAAISATFESTKNTLSLDNQTIVTQFNKTSKSIQAAKQKLDEYNSAKKKLSIARRRKTLGTLDDTSIIPKLESAKSKAWDNYVKAVNAASTNFQDLLAKQDAHQNKQEIDAQRDAVKEKERLEKEYLAEEIRVAEEEKRIKKEKKEAWNTLVNTLNSGRRKMQKSIRSLAASLYVLRRVVNFIKNMAKEISELIQASSSWVENLNLLEVTFSEVADNAKETKDWVSDMANTFSMDKNAIVQYISTFKQMANAMGQASETGENMSKVLTKLGLDIASLRNVKTETAMSDLASAIAGQIKPVRKYGFDITQQSIDALLKEAGISGSASTLSQADKQLARTILLVRQSTDAWGDLGKTINTFANQQRVLTDQIATTKRLLGQIFIGTFKFTDTLDEASKTAGIATKAIWWINGALVAVNEVLESILPTADSVNGAIATLLEETQEDAEELEDTLNGTLASFDKFNVMSKGSNATNENSTLQGLFDEEISEYLKKTQKITSYAREIADILLRRFFPEFDEWRKENDGSFSEWVSKTGKTAGNLISWVNPIKDFVNILENGLQRTITNLPEIITAIFNILVATVKLLEPLAQLIIDIANSLGDKGIVAALKAIFVIVVAIKSVQLAIMAIKNINTIATSVSTLLAPALTNIENVLKVLKEQSIDITETTIPQMQARINGLTSSIMGLVSGFATLAVGIMTYVTFSKEMSSKSKALVISLSAVAGILVGIVTAIATIKAGANVLVGIAKGVAAAAAVTGVTLSVGSTLAATAHAQGGYQTGGLFYAGENGAEWVGRQGNTSTIVNDKQMSDIMQQSVAMGVVQGNRMAGGASGNGSNKVAVVNLDGRRLFEVVQENGKRVGKVFAEA